MNSTQDICISRQNCMQQLFCSVCRDLISCLECFGTLRFYATYFWGIFLPWVTHFRDGFYYLFWGEQTFTFFQSPSFLFLGIFAKLWSGKKFWRAAYSSYANTAKKRLLFRGLHVLGKMKPSIISMIQSLKWKRPPSCGLNRRAAWKPAYSEISIF